MSEGNLKRRIIVYAQNKGKISLTPLADILDDAADEFLGFVYDIHDQFVLDWFKKWFGTELSASMPQVAGGCAGHIDLGKLQDIEKEPDLSKAKPAPFVGTIIKEE
jgi:hypothetical protein